AETRRRGPQRRRWPNSRTTTCRRWRGSPMTITGLSAIDCSALERAFAMARAESAKERERFDEMARKDWQEAARFAAYHCQVRTLRLKPWQAPPMHADDVVSDAPCYGGRPEEVALRQRLLAAGLSVFEPDPIAALAAAKANRVATASNA